jgi:hypothetical protein
MTQEDKAKEEFIEEIRLLRKRIAELGTLFSFAKAIETALLLRRNYSDEEYSCEAKITVLLVLRSRIDSERKQEEKILKRQQVRANIW